MQEPITTYLEESTSLSLVRLCKAFRQQGEVWCQEHRPSHGSRSGHFPLSGGGWPLAVSARSSAWRRDWHGRQNGPAHGKRGAADPSSGCSGCSDLAGVSDGKRTASWRASFAHLERSRYLPRAGDESSRTAPLSSLARPGGSQFLAQLVFSAR